MSAKQHTPPAQQKRDPRSKEEVVAQVFVEALSDSEREQKEIEAHQEKEARMRAVLRAQGLLGEIK